MNILFLDIDGVLNHKPKHYGLDPKCVSILKGIIDRTDAKIVVSSSWKYFPDEPMVSKNWRMTLAEMLDKHLDIFIGDTPDITEFDDERGYVIRKRGLEIREWMSLNKGDYRYVVLDDEVSDIKGIIEDEHIFKTDNNIGLTGEIADSIVKYFNRKG